MRIRYRDRCLWLCLLLAACGDDAPGAPSDAAADSPTDVPMPPPMSRVWVAGNFVTAGANVAGAFTDGEGALPFGPGAAPPIAIANVRAFDARGRKIAYVSDSTVAGRFDLHVAEADNRNAIVVVQGGALNIDITAVALSPDGAKVAFTMDSAAIDGGFDLYVAPTTAGAAPVRVSPDRPAGAPAPAQQDVSAFTWSSDSKLIAFQADLTENAYEQAYVVDTTAAAPAAVELLARADIGLNATGTKGVRGRILFDGADNIYFCARTETDNAQFQMFKATPAGVRTAFELPRRGDGSVADAGAFSIAPDGSKIVFSADAPTLTQANLYVVPTAGGAPTRLTSLAATGRADPQQQMAFSPDGAKVVVLADFAAGNGKNEPFAIDLAAADQAPRRLVNLTATCAGCPNANALTAQWTADGRAIYVRGDLTSSNDVRVFRLDPAATDQTPTLAVTTPVSGSVTSLIVRQIL
jgi:Tol biopolymer transport system component